MLHCRQCGSPIPYGYGEYCHRCMRTWYAVELAQSRLDVLAGLSDEKMDLKALLARYVMAVVEADMPKTQLGSCLN